MRKGRRKSSCDEDLSHQCSETTHDKDSGFTFVEIKEESCEDDPGTGHNATNPLDGNIDSSDFVSRVEHSCHDPPSKKTSIANAPMTCVRVKEEITSKDCESESIDINLHYGKQLADLFLGNF